jgi:hypothetical protein
MVIETTLTRDQFIRLSILRHFQRPTFYFNALTGAAIMAFALFGGGPFILIFFAWIPMTLYILFGVLTAFRDSKIRESPFLPTRYEFGNAGIKVSTRDGASTLGWDDFAGWRIMIGCYVLALKAGSILAIPQTSVSPHDQKQLEDLLTRKIGVRGG